MERPRVFISGVITAMTHLRNPIAKMLEQDLGYEVTLSERHGSLPRTSVAACRKWAQECDIFIGIYGHTYGTIVPWLGISITEMEYLEARKHNPEKILICVQE